MADNIDILSELTAQIAEQLAKFEKAREKDKIKIKKEILELQEKREHVISKLKTELK